MTADRPFDAPRTFPLDKDDGPAAAAMEAASLERRARRRVGMKLRFATHAAVFALVNLGLLAAWAWTGGTHGRATPIWGWGLALGIHGAVVLAGLYGDGWRRRLLDGEIERLRRAG